MKKVTVIMLAFVLALSLSACQVVEVQGLENFTQATCCVGLTKHLFPGEDFLSRFPFIEGDYYYFDSCDLLWGQALASAYITYTPQEYEAAKAYCLTAVALCPEHYYEHDGYIFQEWLVYKSKDDAGNWVAACEFPEHWNMFGYNDETHTLLFVGHYEGDPDSQNNALIQSDFSAYIEKIFSRYGFFGS